jgi:hypothetical protein
MASNCLVYYAGRLAAANADAAAMMAACNNGYIRCYDGVQPALDGSITTQNLLLVLRYAATAAGTPALGVATINALTGANWTANGTPTFALSFKSDGTTVVWSGTFGIATGDFDITIDTLPGVAGQPVGSVGGTYTSNWAL